MITRALCRPLVRPLIGELRGHPRGQVQAGEGAWMRDGASLLLDFIADYYATQPIAEVPTLRPLLLNEFALPLRAA
ncbi:hypothetical protein ACIPK7_06255 [Pseudomonas sp. NPDC086581]|uniref:hypothetical protein n=1 Tax=Pseudomonas sp. NPDC086581 TaxID=3364432 RepID=UPI00382CD6F1